MLIPLLQIEISRAREDWRLRKEGYYISDFKDTHPKLIIC